MGLWMTAAAMSFPVSEASLGNLSASQEMPDATAWLGMTGRPFGPVDDRSGDVIPSERSEPRESVCITRDARRHCVAGHDGTALWPVDDRSGDVIPSERSERRESVCITRDARRHCVAGHDCDSPSGLWMTATDLLS